MGKEHMTHHKNELFSAQRHSIGSSLNAKKYDFERQKSPMEIKSQTNYNFCFFFSFQIVFNMEKKLLEQQ